ncbi:MAG: response regulator [Anaerolineae bacterium]|jgi:DNA-binding NarL/FixJ family response regulator
MIETAEMECIRVLIADDHPVFREGLRHILAADPSVEIVGEADTGEAALREARRCEPDVVILDVNMPTLDGLQAAKRIHQELSNTRVLMLTAFHDEEQMMRAYRVGVAAYFAKDVSPGELLASLRDVKQGRYVVQGKRMSRRELSAWLTHRLSGVAAEGELPEEVCAPLTAREMEVLVSVAHGLSNKELARHLNISEQTVKNHMSSILRKLRVADRTQAAMYAVRHGWVHVHDLAEARA